MQPPEWVEWAIASALSDMEMTWKGIAIKSLCVALGAACIPVLLYVAAALAPTSPVNFAPVGHAGLSVLFFSLTWAVSAALSILVVVPVWLAVDSVPRSRILGHTGVFSIAMGLASLIIGILLGDSINATLIIAVLGFFVAMLAKIIERGISVGKHASNSTSSE
jgi:hypothetical protein